jgi:hypothetical protein
VRRNAALPKRGKTLGMSENASLIRRFFVALVAGPARIVAWSSLYPAYVGYRNGQYLDVVLWSALCTIAFLFWSTASFTHAFDAGPLTRSERIALVLAVAIQMAATFTAVHSATFYLVRAISS